MEMNMRLNKVIIKDTIYMDIEEQHKQSEKHFHESIDFQKKGNPRLITQMYLKG